MENIAPHASRRQFIKTSAVAAAASSLAFPSVTFGKPDSRKLKIGWVGCGGRGSGAINQALKADSNIELWSVADAFQNQLDKGVQQIKALHEGKMSLGNRQFAGLDAYQKVIESGVDVVLLTTPPGFRPQHIKAAVDARKHVFCEKPMAVDGPGVRSVMASIEKAKKQGTSIVDGYVWRWTYSQRDTFKRILDGELGEVRAVYSNYNNNARQRYAEWNRQNTKTDLEWQLRRWYYFNWLSGDHVVEQAVHSIDKLMWAKNDQPPASCVASGGRQVRVDAEYGNIYDHFAVEYQWADSTQGYHFCRQMDNCENGVFDRVFGSKGMYYGESGRKHHVFVDEGKLKWRWDGRVNDGYQTEHDEMYAAIRDGQPINTGDRMIKTTLAGIMARMAAYTGQRVTWEMALNSKEQLGPDKLDWDMKLPVRPVAMPGTAATITPHGWT